MRARNGAVATAERAVIPDGSELSDHNPTADTIVSRVQHEGVSICLSTYGDSEWDLSPYINNANLPDSRKRIVWPSLPEPLINSAKSVCWRYWKAGLYGSTRPVATTLIRFASDLFGFLSWLDGAGITCLSSVTRFHLAAYVEHCRETISSSSSITSRLLAVEACWQLRGSDPDGLPDHPWPGESACYLSGLAATDRCEAKTVVIPDDICRRLFTFTDGLIARANAIISENESVHFPSQDWLLLRSACYFRLGISSGMRNHELSALTTGSCRRVLVSDVSTTWITGESLKTHVGATSWQVPSEAEHIVKILDEMSCHLRAWIAKRIGAIQDSLESAPLKGRRKALLIKSLNRLQKDRDRVFLGFSARNNSVQVPNVGHWTDLLQGLCGAAGCDWKITTHQLRRTFAVFVARHSLGDLRYLRQHFKHVSLDMTALYAAHVNVDHELISEISTAYQDERVSIVSDLLSTDVLISGGASSDLKDFRKGQTVRVFDSRKSLVSSVASAVVIRGTGHGYCLSSRGGCGGTGLYEATSCAGCKNSVITPKHIDVWKALYGHTVELLAIPELSKQECFRINRDLQSIRSVLSDLGCPPSDLREETVHE